MPRVAATGGWSPALWRNTLAVWTLSWSAWVMASRVAATGKGRLGRESPMLKVITLMGGAWLTAPVPRSHRRRLQVADGGDHQTGSGRDETNQPEEMLVVALEHLVEAFVDLLEAFVHVGFH